MAIEGFEKLIKGPMARERTRERKGTKIHDHSRLAVLTRDI